MDSFNVLISPNALSQLEKYVDYIQYTLLNEQAANNLWNDAIQTKDELSISANSHSFCSKQSLKGLGYRRILFRTHKYVMLYRIDDETETVYVEAIYHELQDYENSFSNSMNDD